MAKHKHQTFVYLYYGNFKILDSNQNYYVHVQYVQ